MLNHARRTKVLHNLREHAGAGCQAGPTGVLQDADALADVAQVERVVERAHHVAAHLRDLPHLGQLLAVACVMPGTSAPRALRSACTGCECAAATATPLKQGPTHSSRSLCVNLPNFAEPLPMHAPRLAYVNKCAGKLEVWGGGRSWCREADSPGHKDALRA